MPKKANRSRSVIVRVTVSEQSKKLLGELSSLGIYGRNEAEVAGRFVDAALQAFVPPPKLKQARVGKLTRGG